MPVCNYVEVIGAIDTSLALGALRAISRLPTSGRSLDCIDRTQANLCRSDAYLRDVLYTLHPWRIMREEGATVIYMRERPALTTTRIVLRDDEDLPILIERMRPIPS